MRKQQTTDARRYDVTVHSADGDTNTYKGLTNRQAREYEDLPFTSSSVTVVEVRPAP